MYVADCTRAAPSSRKFASLCCILDITHVCRRGVGNNFFWVSLFHIPGIQAFIDASRTKEIKASRKQTVGNIDGKEGGESYQI